MWKDYIVLLRTFSCNTIDSVGILKCTRTTSHYSGAYDQIDHKYILHSTINASSIVLLQITGCIMMEVTRNPQIRQII